MVLGFDPQVEHTQELQALAAEAQSYIVIGYVLDNGSGFRNELTILAPSGEFLGVCFSDLLSGFFMSTYAQS